jgi:asparagine synthase (glutamine-hydrolysing)
MCGIAGYLAKAEAQTVERVVATMTDALIHRGPDDCGVVSIAAGGKALSFGARRLAIQDLSPAGHQPMSDSTTGNWVILNGEIYNFRDLRVRLEASGVRFVSNSDTEVLLRAYAAWGIETINELRGMFAFALWDARARRLILARDPLGVKPLYYAELHDGGIIFASELRAILKTGIVPRKLCTEGLSSYLRLGAVEEPWTLVEGICALPSGHYGMWGGNSRQITEYWSLRDCFRKTRVSNRPEELRASVHDRLASAIRMRLISDAPLGVFLSGGLDSSTVVALSAQGSSQPLRTVSVVFSESQYSEKEFIDAIARRYGTEHLEICLADQDFVSRLPCALDAMDQPTFDGVNTFVVAAEAKRAGLKVALSGIGGDELFGGYPSFRRVPTLRSIRRHVPRLGRRAIHAASAGLPRKGYRIRKLSQWLASPETGAISAERLTRELFSAGEIDVVAPDIPAPYPDAPGSDGLDDFNSVSLFELSVYLKNVLLRDADVMGMANSVEIREPLLDVRLVELLASLPGDLKKGQQPKGLLIDVMRGSLPEATLERKKQGFSFPFGDWLRGNLHLPVGDSLLDNRHGGALADVLAPEALADVWRHFGEGSASWTRPWALYVLKEWGSRWL